MIFTDIPVPTACAILVCLFTLQKYGTHKIGFLFAPVVIIWIIVITTMGLYNIFRYPSILGSVSPVYIVRFIRNADITSWKLLGRIVLCIAGKTHLLNISLLLLLYHLKALYQHKP